MKNLSPKIEKNIPIPGKDGGPNRVGLLKSMEIGDSFEVDIDELNAYRSSINYLKGIMKFITRTVGTKKGRIWRTA